MQNELLKSEVENAFSDNEYITLLKDRIKPLRKSKEWNRRKASVYRTWEFAEDRLKEYYGKCEYLSPEKVWAVMSAMTTVSINVDVLHAHADPYEAPAVWIADRISESGNMEACARLISSLDAKAVVEDGFMCEDSAHTSQIKDGIAYILKHRNDGCAGNSKSSGRCADLIDRVTMSGKQHQKTKGRRMYDELISLIPEDVLDEAVNAYMSELRKISIEVVEATKDAFLDIESAYIDSFNGVRRIREEQEKRKQAYFGNAVNGKNAAELINAQLNSFAAQNAINRSYFGPMTPDYMRYEVMQAGADRFHKDWGDLYYYINTIGTSAHEQHFLKEFDDTKIRPNVIHNAIEPYLVYFMTLYLADKNDDIAWSMPAIVLKEAAESQLPWAYGTFTKGASDGGAAEDDDSFESRAEERVTEEMLERIYEGDHINRFQNKYSFVDEGETRFSETDASLNQLIYFLSGRIPPRNSAILKGASENISTVELAGADTEMLRKGLAMAAVLKQRNDIANELQFFADIDEENKKELPKQTMALSAKIAEQNDTIRRQAKEIAGLKTQAHAMERHISEATRKAHDAELAKEKYRSELAEMREAMFAMMNEKANSQEEQTDAKDSENILPYEVKRKTLVFGGNESWVKHMKTHLSGNIRWFERNTVPNKEAVKNADVVWLQIHSMGHSDYYNIINVTDNNPDIEVHLLPTHGIVSSALNIATADKEGHH